MIINHLKTKDNHISYHQPQRGALNANCGEHDLVHKEKYQDTGGDGDGGDGDGDGDRVDGGGNIEVEMMTMLCVCVPKIKEENLRHVMLLIMTSV